MRAREILPEHYLDLASPPGPPKKSYLGGRNVTDIFKDIPNDAIKEELRKTAAPCAVLMSHIHGDYNLGNIIRTSNFMFAGSPVYYYGMRRFDKRFTHGSYHYTPPIHLHNLDEVASLKQKYAFICVEQVAGAHNALSFQFPANSLFILGEEQDGIAPELLALGDYFVEIPNKGSIRSLCVSSAFALIAGLYLNIGNERK